MKPDGRICIIVPNSRTLKWQIEANILHIHDEDSNEQAFTLETWIDVSLEEPLHHRARSPGRVACICPSSSVPWSPRRTVRGFRQSHQSPAISHEVRQRVRLPHAPVKPIRYFAVFLAQNSCENALTPERHAIHEKSELTGQTGFPHQPQEHHMPNNTKIIITTQWGDRPHSETL